jgi:hypothetical protein
MSGEVSVGKLFAPSTVIKAEEPLTVFVTSAGVSVAKYPKFKESTATAL